MSADAVSNEEEGRLGDGSVHDAIASNLRGARLAKGLSLRELARRIGTSKALLSQIENVQANPTIDVLERIATALNLSIGDLIRTPLLCQRSSGGGRVRRSWGRTSPFGAFSPPQTVAGSNSQKDGCRRGAAARAMLIIGVRSSTRS